MVRFSLNLSSSKAGQTYFTPPETGIMATIVRSLGHHLTPVKYSKEVPLSNISAPMLFLASSCCAFVILNSRSSLEIGFTSSDSEKSILEGLSNVFATAEDEAFPTLGIKLTMTASAPTLIKSFRFKLIRHCTFKLNQQEKQSLKNHYF